MAILFQTNPGMFPFEIISRFRNSVSQKSEMRESVAAEFRTKELYQMGRTGVSREL